jgi:hypothetical protein
MKTALIFAARMDEMFRRTEAVLRPDVSAQVCTDASPVSTERLRRNAERRPSRPGT